MCDGKGAAGALSYLKTGETLAPRSGGQECATGENIQGDGRTREFT
jgi:hypothetical protein